MPKAKKESARVIKPKKKLDYHLEVQVNDNVYKGDAASILQALTDFVNSPNYPFAVKTQLVFRFSRGDKTRQRNYYNPRSRVLLKRLKFDPKDVAFLADQLEKELSG